MIKVYREMVSFPILLFFFLVTFLPKAKAQQNFIFANYKPYINAYNPAALVKLEGYNIAMLGRQQWVIEGAPQTFLFNGTAMFGEKNIGFGLNLSNDKSGPENSFGIYTDAVYRVDITNTSGVVFGLKGGFRKQSLDLSLLETTPNSKKNLAEGTFLPDFGAGIYAYYKDFHLGFSLPSFYTQVKKNGEYTNERLLNVSYYAMAGAHFNFSPYVYLDTDLLFQINKNLPSVLDLSAMLSIHQRIKGGFGYRTNGQTYLKTQFGILKNIYLGYAFETRISGLSRELGNSHEVMLSYRFYSKGDRQRFNEALHPPRYNF